MACNCKKSPAAAKFVHTSSEGKSTTYTSEVQAQAARIKFGGTYKKIAG